MACSEWEDTGLLYSSKELDVGKVKQFEEHLSICNECKVEVELYQKEKVQFFNLQNLQELPSQEVDKEILRVCSNSRKHVTSIWLLPSFLKKTAFSVTFFIVGFMVVGYFAMNYESSSKQKIIVENESESKLLQASVAEENKDSLLSDSANDSNIYFSQSRGSLEAKGVVPVDLKN